MTLIASALIGPASPAHADLGGILSQCRPSWLYYRTHPAVVTSLVSGNGGLLVGATH